MRSCVFVYLGFEAIKSTIACIYMPLLNKCVRYCHINTSNSSFNGAFIAYILLIVYRSFLKQKHKK